MKKRSETMYRHEEAFRQMLYICGDCGFLEILWNSRDGVTPFGISCRSCAGDALHKHWQLDHQMPEDWKPPTGSRKFVNMPPFRLREILMQRIERIQNSSDCRPICGDTAASKEEALELLFESEWKDGIPDVVIV